MLQQYCPDSDDDNLVFNLRRGEPEDTQANKSSALPVYDSDDAPDDVSFAASKNAALSLRQAEEQNKKDLQLQQKEKKRRDEEQLRAQKEARTKRLESLATKRLPDSLFENIDAKPLKLRVVTPSKPKQEKTSTAPMKFEDDHYIPLRADRSSTEFSVAVLESRKWKNKLTKPGCLAAKDFRQTALYNANIKRESTKSLQEARQKQRVRSLSVL